MRLLAAAELGLLTAQVTLGPLATEVGDNEAVASPASGLCLA